MSRHSCGCRVNSCYRHNSCNRCASYGYRGGQGCCNFSSLTILILILLQFKGNSFGSSHGVDKGIIFIIALYYLSCCSHGYRGLLGGY